MLSKFVRVCIFIRQRVLLIIVQQTHDIILLSLWFGCGRGKAAGISGGVKLIMSSEKLEEHEEALRSLLRDLETQITHTLPTANGGT